MTTGASQFSLNPSTANVRGFEGYKRALSVLSPKQQRRIWRGIFRATGSTIVQKQARKNLRAQGHKKLARNVTTRAKATNFNVFALIGARRKTRLGSIGHFIEQGTRPHMIRPRRKKALARGRVLFGARVRHPGSSGRPWLAPAVKSTAQQVSDDITRRAIAEVEKVKGRA